MLRLCKIFSWDTLPFKSAFEKCKEKSLELNWFFKGKLFRSPDRKFFFGLLHVVDIALFELYQVVYDANKMEMARRLCFKDSVPVFTIAEAAWNQDSESFFYKFKGPAKVFQARVEDILNNVFISLDTSTSKFFK